MRESRLYDVLDRSLPLTLACAIVLRYLLTAERDSTYASFCQARVAFWHDDFY